MWKGQERTFPPALKAVAAFLVLGILVATGNVKFRESSPKRGVDHEGARTMTLEGIDEYLTDKKIPHRMDHEPIEQHPRHIKSIIISDACSRELIDDIGLEFGLGLAAGNVLYVECRDERRTKEWVFWAGR